MSLTPAERDTMSERLRVLTRPVRLAVYTRPDGCDTCAETLAIVDAVVALSPHLSTEAHVLAADALPPGVAHVPAIVVLGEVDGAFVDQGVRLVGAPIEHELTALAEGILAVGGAAPPLSADTLTRLAALEAPVHIEVFSTPTCVYCPRAVAMAHRLALASPLVSATGYSVIEFPDLIRRYRVTGVPKIVVGPHGAELLGAQPEAAFVDAVVGHSR